MYSKAVYATVRAVGSAGKHSYSNPHNVAIIVAACDAGLLKLVPDNNHKDVLFDTNWNVKTGIELTPRGREIYATLPPAKIAA